MVVVASDPPPREDDDVPVRELVFSCCICQATVTDVYATVESNHGFHSGSSSEDGIVTKMWITSCSHVTCSKHLQNGAVPFHPQDQQPRAPCPKCTEDKNDDTPKDLFSIQGLEEGQYDPTIPPMWMNCPAIKLDDSIPGMDAVRFQYMALCHYGRQVRKHWNVAMQQQSDTIANLTKERKARKQLQSEQAELHNRVAALPKLETQLKKWEERKPVINHYMHGFTEMTKDNDCMRRQLIELGFDVPLRSYVFEPAEAAKPSESQSDDVRMDSQPRAAPLPGTDTRLQQLSGNEQSSSARKRKRDHALGPEAERNSGDSENLRRASRDLMPPPLPRATLVQERPAEAPGDRHQKNHSQKSNQPHAWGVWRQERDDEEVEHRHDLNQHHGHLLQRGELRLETPRGRQYASPAYRLYTEPQDHISTSRHMYQPRIQAQQYDPISIAQLSLQSSGQADIPSVESTYNQATSSFHSAPKSMTASHDPYHSPNYMFSYDEHGHHEQGQPRAVSQHFASDHRVAHRTQNSIEMDQRQSGLRPQPSAASSPFFRRGDDVVRSTTIRRPPARRNNALPRLPTEDGRHSIPTASRSVPQTDFQSQSRPYYMHEHQPAYQHRQSHALTINEPQQNRAVPQTPRNSQGVFQRSVHDPQPHYRSPTKAQPPSYGKRITLPPSTGPSMPMSASQDQVLSQIRDVRGVSSYGNIPSWQSRPPSYSVARPPYSGRSRQSLRR